MNIIDRMFKFPVRIYDEDGDNSFPGILPSGFTIGPGDKWVTAWRKIFFEDLVDIGETFHIETDIDDVIKDGMNASIISTVYKTYVCDWPLHILEKKLTEHISRIENVKKPKKVKPIVPIKDVKDSADNIALK